MLGKRSLVISIIQFTIRFSAITLISLVLFHDLISALIIGIVAGMASAGPLTRLLTETGLTRTDEGTSIFSQVLVIEIAAVVVFSFVYNLAGKSFTVGSFALIGGELVVAIVGIILFGRFVMIPLLEFVEKRFTSREAVFAILIGVLLIMGFIGQTNWFQLRSHCPLPWASSAEVFCKPSAADDKAPLVHLRLFRTAIFRRPRTILRLGHAVPFGVRDRNIWFSTISGLGCRCYRLANIES